MREIKNFKVLPASREQIRAFIETNHYSKSINGCRFSHGFALYDGEEMIGAAFFGGLAMANQWRRFGASDAEVLELRRLCCIDDTPKNTESFFIGYMLRWLKRNAAPEVKTLVSYADQEQGHAGVIYRATNWQYLGHKKGSKIIVSESGKTYHDKTIRTKYRGELKPFARALVAELQSGKAFYKTTAGKHAFVFKLRK